MKLHSPEYENALKDYSISIKNGYYFKKANIFSKFVDDLYLLRSQYPKKDPMNLTCKLIMNSLYGRFGMAPIGIKQKFIKAKDFKDFSLNNEITDFLDLEESGFFISYIDKKFKDKKYNISVSIASSVTSYSRIFMSKFKNNLNYKLYYTDTDSIFIDKDLTSLIIGKNLGQFKLEYIFNEAVFLGPKIYAGITSDNQYISKVKGYKNSKNIPLEDFKKLLNINYKSLELNHQKWYKSLMNSSIEIKEQLYTLIATENKRKFILDKEGKIIETIAFKIEK